MTDLGILLESMSSVFNKSTPDNNSVLDLNEDKTLKWRTLHNNQFACKKKGDGGQTNNINSSSTSSIATTNLIGSISNNTSNNNNSSSSSSSNDCNSSSNNSNNIIANNTSYNKILKTCNSQKEDAYSSLSSIDAKKINPNSISSSTNHNTTNKNIDFNNKININTLSNNMKSDQSKKLQEKDKEQDNNIERTKLEKIDIPSYTNSNNSDDSSSIAAKLNLNLDKKNEGQQDTNEKFQIKEENIDKNSKITSVPTTSISINNHNIATTVCVTTTNTTIPTATTATTTGTKRTRSSEPSPSERCLRRSKPNEVNSTSVTLTNDLKSTSTVPSNNSTQQQQQLQQPQIQPRRRGRSKKIPITTTTNDEENLTTTTTNNNKINIDNGNNDGPSYGPKKLRRNCNMNKNEMVTTTTTITTTTENSNPSLDIKKLDLDIKDTELTKQQQQQPSQQKHKTRRSTRLEVKIDNNEEITNDTKDTAEIKQESQTPTEEKQNFALIEKSTIQQSVAEKTPPKKRGRRAKVQQTSPNVVEANINSPHTSSDSTNIDGIAASTTITTTIPLSTPSTTSTMVAYSASTTSLPTKITNSKQPTKENISIPSLTSQRPLRRIKPTPKILENDELRYEFETKNIARITACTEMQSTNELEMIKNSLNSSSNNSNGKKDTRDSTLITNITPGSSNSNGKSSSNSSVCSERANSNLVTVAAVNEVKKKLFSKKNGNTINSPSIVYPPMPEKKPCPDPEKFLNEIKAAKLNLNRSPEDKKLNRKQHRRLLKQKEKHFEKLGLRRNTRDEPSESEISSGEDEFVPANSKKINVGKTNVTLRHRAASSRDPIKDSNHINVPGPSKVTHNNKYSNSNNIPKQQSQQQPTLELKQQEELLQQCKDNLSTINQILKQTGGKQVCPIPISTTGSVTITPITTGTNQRKKRNQTQSSPSISQVNISSLSKDNSLSQSQTDDNIQRNLVTTVRPNVTIATRIQMPENLICLCQKPSHYYTRNIPGTAYCCAIDNIEEQKVGCCNQLSGELLNLLRPSQRVGYMILCDDHLKRLRAHNCCANCGMFCTQGKFVLCQQKHFFHAECAQKFILNSPYDPSNATNYTSPTLVLKCPHCGQDTPEKTSVVTMKCQKLPVFLPSQKLLNKPAKMSVSDGQQSNKLPKRKLPVCVELENLIPESVMNVVVREASTATSTSSEFSSRDMFYAVNNDDLERVAEILASGYDITCEMSELLNGTCLHLVAHFGTVQMAYLLLCRESSSEFLNLVDKELRTALMCSIIGEKIDILKLLIQCGANLTLKGPDGMTCLHIAAKLGNVEAAQLILENHKNNTSICKFEKFINSQDDGGWTAIVWAAELGFTEIVSLLLNYGANPNICDAENNSVLHWATLSHHVDTISILLRSNIDCSIQNITGDTPLHIACRTSATRVCLMLIANGADLMVKNKAGELPYDCIENEDNQCARAVGFNMQMRSFGSTGLKNKIVCSDISNGRESNPIQVIKRLNDRPANNSSSNAGSSMSINLSGNSEVDDIMLPDFKYITKSILLQTLIQIEQRVSQMRICNCSDGCNSENCQCSTISIQNWYTPEGRLIGEFNFDDPPMIFECNDVCGCNKLLCKNRVVQNGIKIPLQVFECEERSKGWGVRTLINIPRGTFIAEYTGEILTDLEADRRTDDSYFFDLGASEHCIDSNFYGNLTRFLNHSCVANIIPVRVYYDHQDCRFPKIAFFASKDISSGEELCFDYGEKFWSVKQRYFTCKCLYPQCRYSKLLKITNNNNKTSAITTTAVNSSSSSTSSFLSSISSATSKIPAGTTITTITTTNNNNNNNVLNAIINRNNDSNVINNSNSNNNINNNYNLSNRSSNNLPNVSIVL